MMSRRQLILVALILAIMVDPAFSELQGATKGAPNFTNDELVIISRNAALSEVVRSDPWVIRRVLDAIAEAHRRPAISNQAQGAEPPSPTPESFDPNENPDVQQLQRASPEAVHDLFQLLKQAAANRPTGPK